MKKQLLLTFLLNACVKDPEFHDLSSSEHVLVEHSVLYAHTEAMYVGRISSSRYCFWQ